VEENIQTESPCASPSFEELAIEQGVGPIHDFDAFLGKSSAEDESPEEFAAMLREWRTGDNRGA
jgi:hypothetical protein